MAIHVNVDNFARAETDRMFGDLLMVAGGINRWHHARLPTPVDGQTVIRMNRDTLYSVAIVDLAGGAVLTLPDAGDRYLSAMVVSEDHYINQLIHDPGDHELTEEVNGTRYVAVAVRTLVDPGDPVDVAAVNALQDRITLGAPSAEPFAAPEYDRASLDATRAALLQLAAGVEGFADTFGARDAVDPVRHLLGTAAGWGGLPETEAYYVNAAPGLPVGEYDIRIGDVPVDAFWSISMYDDRGFFKQNDQGSYSINDLTAVRDDDGGITVRLGLDASRGPNFLPISDGWNYIVRLYRPRPEVLDGSWSFPLPVPAGS
jgi:hypothetical protein